MTNRINPLFLDSKEANFFTNTNKMIPFFTPENYFAWLKTFKNKVLFTEPLFVTEPISFTTANKISHHRRILHVPHPEHYAYISAKVTELTKKMGTSLSLENCWSVKHNAAKNNFSINDFKIITESIFLESVGFQYHLKIDISKFYPSIYTHSIPWAVLGKEDGKNKYKNKSLRCDLFNIADNIDKALRRLNNDQTKGIPIGCTVFSIIASVITNRISLELKDFLNRKNILANFKHYSDDYYIFCNTESEAKIILSEFTNIVRRYELQLNDKKTAISHVDAVSFEPFWINICNESLNSIRNYYKNKKRYTSDVIAALEKVRSLRKKNFKGEHITGFFLSSLMALIEGSLMNTGFSEDFVFLNYLIPYVIQCCFLEPSAIRYLIRPRFLTVLKKQVKEKRFRNIFVVAIPQYCLEHYYSHELLWSLDLIRRLELLTDLVQSHIFPLLQQYDCPLIKCVLMEIEFEANFTESKTSLYKKLNPISKRKHDIDKLNSFYYGSEWILYFYFFEKNKTNPNVKNKLLKNPPSKFIKSFLELDSSTFFYNEPKHSFIKFSIEELEYLENSY